MAIIEQDANGNKIYTKDPNGNEIGIQGKVISGILLVLVTLLTMLLIIAHWPDRLPPVNEKASTKYYYKFFSVTYVGVDGVRDDSTVLRIPKNIANIKKDTVANENTNIDTTAEEVDTTISATALTTQTDTNRKPITNMGSSKKAECLAKNTHPKSLIDLNTLLLLLVALSGFLGNMIHVGTSFTTFVGAGKFKRSWLLWYFVKPFTAAALAVGVYIIFRAGFLNSGDVAASVNLYGVIAIAVFAGLFTDMATQKLKEVFAVVFQSGSTRPDPLSHAPITITSVSPDPLPLNLEVAMVISGEGFANRTLTIKIDGEEIEEVLVKPNALLFSYTALKEKPEMILYDEKNVEIIKYTLITETASTVQPIPALVKVDTVDPATIVVGKQVIITINGSGLQADAIVVKMGDAVITNFTGSTTTITFTYTASETGIIKLLVTDKLGNELNKTDITATVANE